MKRAKFDRKGLLAIRPQAWGLEFLFGEVESRAPFEMAGPTAIVTIEGPLTHHSDWWCDSYDAIRERVSGALASDAKNVLLVIDSPGGDVSGCFETARELRAMALEKGKPLVSYVEGMGCSGGYALACAGEQIAVSETAVVGSIGVVTTMLDVTKQDAMFGEKYTLIASGARKTDGNPHVATSDEAVASMQTTIDRLAELFFAWVGEARASSGLNASGARVLEAGIFVGAAAKEKHLADQVTTRSALLAELAKAPTNKTNKATPAAKKNAAKTATEAQMGWKEALREAAEGGDDEAKKCLEALEKDGDKGDEPPPSEKKEGEASEGGESKEKKAEVEPEKKGDEEPEKKAAAAVSQAIDGAIEAAVAERMKPIEIKALLDERAKVDPGMPESFRKMCMSRASVEDVKAILAATPKFHSIRNEKATQAATAGAGEQLEGAEREAMDLAMGVKAQAVQMPERLEDGSFKLHVVKPSELRDHLQKTARSAAQTGK